MDDGLFIIHNYLLKNKLLGVGTICHCLNNPSINADLTQVKNIISKVFDIDISIVVPLTLNY